MYVQELSVCYSLGISSRKEWWDFACMEWRESITWEYKTKREFHTGPPLTGLELLICFFKET